MARTVEQINDYIKAQLVINFAAIGITINTATWSTRSILRAICWTVATCQALMEQLQDLFQQTIEAIQARAAAASTLWVQDAMFKFQYSATVPQILQFITVVLTSPTGVPFDYLYVTYPTIDVSLRIITACSVKSNVSGRVNVKIAKGNPLVALSAPELLAAQSYIYVKGAAGITYIVTSNTSDKLFVEATIWYQGSYSAVIKANVITALNDFLQNLSITDFDGSIKLSDIEGLIRNVPGVNDVLLTNVKARKDADAFSAGTDLILNNLVISRLYNTVAGYIVEETTATHTFTDSLTFIAQ